MIILKAGDSIKAEASAESSINIILYGIEQITVETYKELGRKQLTGAGTQDLVYTAPVNTTSVASVIVITNYSDTNKQVKIWHIPSGSSVNNANLIIPNIVISANTIIVWNKGEFSVLPIPPVVYGLTANPPAHYNSVGVAGQMAYDDDYFYICVAENRWGKTPMIKNF